MLRSESSFTHNLIRYVQIFFHKMYGKDADIYVYILQVRRGGLILQKNLLVLFSAENPLFLIY